ncbi:MAG: hypothetical protein ACLGHX_02130, partial [Acidimicrobiia bacterium]
KQILRASCSLLAIGILLSACSTDADDPAATGGATQTAEGPVVSTTKAIREQAFDGVPLPEGATERVAEGITSPEDIGLASFGGAWRGGEFETIDFDMYAWAAREYESAGTAETVVDFYREHSDALQEISPPFSGLYFWGRDDDQSRVLFVFITEGTQPDTSMFLVLEGRRSP